LAITGLILRLFVVQYKYFIVTLSAGIELRPHPSNKQTLTTYQGPIGYIFICWRSSKYYVSCDYTYH